MPEPMTVPIVIRKRSVKPRLRRRSVGAVMIAVTRGGRSGGGRSSGQRVERAIRRVLATKAGDLVAAAHRAEEARARGHAPRTGDFRRAREELLKVRWDLDEHRRDRRVVDVDREVARTGKWREDGSRAVGADRPIRRGGWWESGGRRRQHHDETVGREAVVQRARGDAVHVLDVVDETNAETIEVEMRVARLERVERPQHARDAAARELGALHLLEVPADARAADVFADA